MDSVKTVSTPIPLAEPKNQYEEKIPAEVTLNTSIQRGEQLRKKKRLNFQNVKSTLHIVEEDDQLMKRYRIGDVVRCRSRKPMRTQPKACNAKTCSTYKTFGSPTRSHVSRSTSPGFVTRPICSRAYTSASLSLNNRRRVLRCPLRIAELATPTKRHCIETWRDRSHVLPTHMLERLKQNVMNQKIVASIPDAVNCFKVRKNASSAGKRPDSRCRNLRKLNKQSQETADIRLMSAVFAHRVAAQMIKPMNIYLSEELQRLGNIVGDEIAKLIQNRRICADYVYNRELLKEMSAKVTVWISDILANAQYKLLEDELRVIKTEENKMGKEGNLVTLIDQYVRWQMEDPQEDLEEEAGPALDAIETLVDNVMEICLPRTDSSSFDYESPEPEGDNRTLPAISSNINEDDEYQDKDDYDENMELSGQTTPIETQALNDLPDVTGMYHIPERLKQEFSDDDDSASKYGSTVDLESNASNAGDNNIVVGDDEEHQNVSDVNVKLEEPLDDRKKVKFTQNERELGDIGTYSPNREGTGAGRNARARETANTGAGGRTGINEPGRIKSNETLEKWPHYAHSATLIRSDIVFQPPNQSILSVVDESWPEDNTIPVLRPSTSVSKSITSLGEIKEVDEPDLPDERFRIFKEGIYHKDFKDTPMLRAGGTMFDTKLFEQDDEYINSTPSKNQTMHTAGMAKKIENRKDELLQDEEQESFNIIPPSRLLSDLQALIAEQAEQIRENQIREQNHIVETESFNDDGKGDYTVTQITNPDDTDTERNPIIQAIKEKLINETKSKFDYRVRPQTAPAWALSSPSEDSMPVTRKKMRLGTCELRKWCKDIEHTLINLEEWNKWMVTTCKKVLFMQEKTEANKYSPLQYRMRVMREWMKLKRSIDKDAILWRKLNDRTFEVLKSYPARSKFTSRSKLPVPKQKLVDKESLLDSMLAIEGQSTWLHRSIVSTEHVIRCHCQTLTAKSQVAVTSKKLR